MKETEAGCQEGNMRWECGDGGERGSVGQKGDATVR